MKIAIASTVKSEPQALLDFLDYHLDRGIDFIYLFFDDPEDRAIPIVSSYERVSSFLCDDRHWSLMVEQYGHVFPHCDLTVHTVRQRFNATHALELSRKDGIDWMMHIDVDEYVFPIRRLRRILNRTVFRSLRYTILEAVNIDAADHIRRTDVEYFKAPAGLSFPTSLKYPVNSLKLAICSVLFGGGQPIFKKFIQGHTKSKVIFRTTNTIRYCGIHEPKYYGPIPTRRLFRIYLLHYYSMGYAPWKEKLMLKIPALGKKKYGPSISKMIRLAGDYRDGKISDDELRDVYLRNIVLDPDLQKRLVKFGLVRRLTTD